MRDFAGTARASLATATAAEPTIERRGPVMAAFGRHVPASPGFAMVVGDDTTPAEVAADVAELARHLGDGLEVVAFERVPLLGSDVGRTFVAEARDAGTPAMGADATLFTYARPNGSDGGLLVRQVEGGLELREFEGRPGLFAPHAVRTFLPAGGKLSDRTLRDPLRAERGVAVAAMGEEAARRANRAARARALTRDADMLVALLGAMLAVDARVVDDGPGRRRVLAPRGARAPTPSGA